MITAGRTMERRADSALPGQAEVCRAALTVDDPLDPPDAQGDDEADGVPGAARPVGHRGGHHGGQRQHDDSAVKHLSDRFGE